jgi:undecaprenyl pyrophosphate synthase
MYWPDFGRDQFISAIDEYKSRERRFGALKQNAK